MNWISSLNVVLSQHECGSLEIQNMMMTIVTNPRQCNQVTPKLLFVGIVFVLPGLGCIAASDRVSKLEL